MLKYSRQREAIKTFLAGRYDHPTAETVYLGIKEEFPNISLGTVYRNLSLLHINVLANQGFDGEIEGHITYFYGKCADCKKNS